MRIIKALAAAAADPKNIIYYMHTLGLLRPLSDRQFIKLMYRMRAGCKLNLENPQGFNEKLQWLNLNDRRSLYTDMVDKYKAREYVERIAGPGHLIPLLGVWNDPDEIDFNALPERFVLKCTHNSGEGMYLCSDKAKLDIPSVKADLKRALSKNYYRHLREWAYKDVKPRIIAEEFVVDPDPANTAGTLIDYKFYCFGGEPRFLYVGTDDISSGRKGEARFTFYNFDWTQAPFQRRDHKAVPIEVAKPPCLDEMIRICAALSEGIPFVRVDLYWVNGKILFSEFTFLPGGGYGLLYPEQWEREMGQWIKLPENRVK